MNVLDKILEEIKEKWGDDERHLIAKGIQAMYIQTEKIIRTYMDETPFTNVESNIDKMASIDSAIKILKNLQNPRIDYADMVGAPAFCHGKRYVFPEPEDYAIQTALIALNKKKECNIHRNNVVNSDINSKCSECSRRKWYQKGYEDGKKDMCKDDWIPVEDGLPEEGEEVEVTIEEMADSAGGMIYYTKTAWVQEERWVIKRNPYNPRVIAWRPLPKPYNPENRNNNTTKEYQQEVEHLLEEIKSENGYVRVSDLAKRFEKIDHELFKDSSWNLLQILSNINILVPEHFD